MAHAVNSPTRGVVFVGEFDEKQEDEHDVHLLPTTGPFASHVM